MHNAPVGTPVTTTVAALSDHHLLQRIKELSAVEHHIEAVVSDHLREIERRRLYLTLGCSSMFDYAVRELGYSTGAAWRRLKTMRLCAEVQGARTRLQEGTLTLDAAAQLQHAFERQRRKQSQAGGDVGAQAGAGSATPVITPAIAPNGLTPAPAREAPVMTPKAERPAAPVLDLAARESLVAQAAGKSTRQVQEMLAEVDPELARTTDRMRPVGAGRWELKAVINDDCQRGLEQLKGLLSHVDPQMTTGQLLGRLVQEALDRHDPSRPPRGRRGGRGNVEVAGATSAPKDPAARNAVAVPRTVQPAGAVSSSAATPAGRPATASSRTAEAAGATSAPKEAAAPDTAAAAGVAASAPKVGGGPQHQAAPAAPRKVRPATAGAAPPQSQVRRRAIPAAVRRQVWKRDRGCCSYVDRASGRRCGSRHLLEIDHVVPYALGGSAEPDNLRLLCAAHHRHRHARRGDTSRRIAVCRWYSAPPTGERARTYGWRSGAPLVRAGCEIVFPKLTYWTIIAERFPCLLNVHWYP